MKLYKYMPWRPFKEKGELHEEYHVKKNLLNSQLYFNSVDAFNDPFDISPYINFECTSAELKYCVTKYLKDKYNISKTKAGRMAPGFIKDKKLDKAEIRNSRAALIKEDFTKCGVCCFTTNNPETTLMWSHYSDSHKGICLMFDIPSNALLFLGYKPEYLLDPRKVNYETKLPEINLTKIVANDIVRAVLTKSIDWKYENEYRAIVRRKIGPKPVNFDPRFLTHIVAGCKMPDKEFEELKRTIAEMKMQPQLLRAQKKQLEYGFDLITV